MSLPSASFCPKPPIEPEATPNQNLCTIMAYTSGQDACALGCVYLRVCVSMCVSDCVCVCGMHAPRAPHKYLTSCPVRVRLSAPRFASVRIRLRVWARTIVCPLPVVAFGIRRLMSGQLVLHYICHSLPQSQRQLPLPLPLQLPLSETVF